MSISKLFSAALLITAALMSLTACGGGSSSSSAPVATTTVSGSVFAGPDAGTKVSAKDAVGNTIAGPVTAAADGTYTINIPTASLSASLRIEAAGGTFVDEATGSSTTAGALAACTKAGSLTAGSSVNIDPSSTIICSLVTSYGKTLDDATTIFNSAFGYTPDTSIAPKNAPSSVTDGSDAPQRLAALRAGAFSQLTKDLGLTPDKQFDLLGALARDLADDGKLNGSAGAVNGITLTEDIQNKYEHSLVGFQKDTTHNLTGLTPDQIGSLPFSKVALTNTYRVEYLPGMMAAAQGKTSFKIRITNRTDGSAATGLAVSLMPLMHMSTMSHSSPVDAVTEDSAAPGTYKCTAYYLMASGAGMGYWELNVMIGGMFGNETVTFYPAVGMSMGSTTVRATLKGQNDMIAGSMGPEKRSYYIFNDGITGNAGANTFGVFLAVKESMMNMPVLKVGETLHDQNNAAWIVNSITVQMSVDGSTWVAAANNGGHWSAAGLTGLSAGQAGTIFVKVTVNNEQKTTDGNAVAGTNGYASFTVTP